MPSSTWSGYPGFASLPVGDNDLLLLSQTNDEIAYSSTKIKFSDFSSQIINTGDFIRVGVGGNYLTLADALDGEESNNNISIILISDITETKNYQITSDKSISIFNPAGYTVNMGQYSPFVASSASPILNINYSGGKIIWDYTSGSNLAVFNMINAFSGTRVQLSNVRLEDSTSSGLSFVFYGSTNEDNVDFNISNFYYILPNIQNCGFSSVSNVSANGSSSTILNGVIVGGGSNCGYFIVGKFKAIENIYIGGVFDTADTSLPFYNILLTAGETNVRNISNYTSSGVNIQTSGSIVSGWRSYGSSTIIRVNQGVSTISDFFAGNDGKIIFGNTGYAKVSQSFFGSAEFSVGDNITTFVGCGFSNQASLDFGISLGGAVRSLNLIGCDFAGNVTVFGQNILITNCTFPTGTMTITPGTQSARLIGNLTLSAIVDNETATQDIGNALFQIAP